MKKISLAVTLLVICAVFAFSQTKDILPYYCDFPNYYASYICGGDLSAEQNNLPALVHSIPTESAFALDLRREIIISSLSLGVFFGSLLVPENKGIPNVNRNDINIIDRYLMFNHGSFNVVTTAMRPIIGLMPLAVPALMTDWRGLFGEEGVRDAFCIWFTHGIMYAQAVGFTYGVRRVIGRAVERHRPYYILAGVDDKETSAGSFPSGTTSMSFLAATLFSVTFSAEFPDSRWRIPVIVGSHMLATTVGAARIITGHHYLTDVLAGAAIGSFFGWLIPTLHRRPPLASNGENYVSFHFTGNEAIMSLRL